MFGFTQKINFNLYTTRNFLLHYHTKKFLQKRSKSRFQIWTCGLNDHRVLGIVPPPPQVLHPRPLTLLSHPVRGISAVKYHTVAWGDKAIYSWGLHGGQLGHDRNGQKYVVVPKLVPVSVGDDVKIIAVAASVGATAFATSKGDVYVLHEYQCRKIGSRWVKSFWVCLMLYYVCTGCGIKMFQIKFAPVQVFYVLKLFSVIQDVPLF